MIIFLVFTFWKYKVLPKYRPTGVPSRMKTMACFSAAAWIPEPGAGKGGANARQRLDGSLLDNRAVKYYTKGKISFLTPAGYRFLPGSRGVFVI